MNKIRILIIGLLVSVFVLMTLIFLSIKGKEEFQQKAILAREIHRVLQTLMVDIYQARKGSFDSLPADGLWHKHIVIDHGPQGILEYFTKKGRLFRINNGKVLMAADNIVDLRIRRQMETPNILEIQIDAQKDVSLISNLKIRIHS